MHPEESEPTCAPIRIVDCYFDLRSYPQSHENCASIRKRVLLSHGYREIEILACAPIRKATALLSAELTCDLMESY